MKLLIMSLLMLSLSLLTACGSSGSSGGDPKVDPVPVDPVPVDPVPNDLESLDSVLIKEANENQRFALTIPEYKDSNSYAFTGVDGDNVELLAEEGKVVFKVEADFETQPSYNFIMTVTNVLDQMKDINVTVNIIDIPEDLNSLPSVMTEDASENNRFAFTIPEYKNTNSYAFSGVDGDKVKLWPERGEVIFNNAPDFETKDSYSFVMIVTNEMEQAKEIEVTVNIKDITNDFIFEIAKESNGTLKIIINDSQYQEKYETYSFTVTQDDGTSTSYAFLGDTSENNVRLKLDMGSLEKDQLFTITPNSDDGLPGITFFPNFGTVEIKVIQWGDNSWQTLEQMFLGACKDENFTFSDQANSPNLLQVTNMAIALSGCTFTENLGYWDVSKVTGMGDLFTGSKGTANISQWDVSSVADMSYMFASALGFNSVIADWEISTVTNMEGMFVGSKVFDQDISGWDVTNVTNCADFRGDAVLSDAHTPNFQNCTPTAAP